MHFFIDSRMEKRTKYRFIFRVAHTRRNEEFTSVDNFWQTSRRWTSFR